jgi:protoporphyrinogen/coproporphyrinogen III oxidase
MAELRGLDVLVIGGGLAGLTAALELQRLGHDVLLLERGTRLGGKAGSTHTDAGEFPAGPTSFNGRAPAFWTLLDLLHLNDEVVRLHPSSSARYVVRDGALQGLRPHPLSVLFTGALSLGDKWALAKELFFPKPARTDSEDESLHDLLVRRFGAPTVEHFFAAVMTGIFAGDLRKLSAHACMPALATAEKEYGSLLKGALRSMRTRPEGTKSGLYTFKRGFGTVGDRAAERIPHRLNAAVTSLTQDRHGVTATVGTTTFHARAVVLATEADTAATLLKSLNPTAASTLSHFEYAPITLVQWAEEAPGDSRLPQGFGYLAAPVEQLFALGSLFVGDLRGETPRRFSTFIGGALHPERALASDATLVDHVAKDLTHLTRGRLGKVHTILRWQRAVFQPAVGHPTRVASLRQALEGQPIALAGSYLGGAAMKDAIGSGLAAAAALAPVLQAGADTPGRAVA